MSSKGTNVWGKVGERERVETAEGPAIVVCMDRDNDCLYAAVSHQLHVTGIVQDQLGEVGGRRHKQHARELRRQVVDYIRARRDRFWPHALAMALDSSDDNTKMLREPYSDKLFNWYLQQVSRAGEVWGGEESLVALSNLFNVQIRIYRAQRETTPAAQRQRATLFTPDSGQSTATLKLIYRFSMAEGSAYYMHYDSVHRVRERRVPLVQPNPPTTATNTPPHPTPTPTPPPSNPGPLRPSELPPPETQRVAGPGGGGEGGRGEQSSRIAPTSHRVRDPRGGVGRGQQTYKLIRPMARSCRLATWNVRTLYRAGKAINVTRHLSRLNIKIAALQEVRWPDEGTAQVEDYTFYWKGASSDNIKELGVGFAIHKSVNTAVTNFIPRNKRLCAIILEGKVRPVAIICCHAPWNSKKLREETEAFYNGLSKLFAELPRRAVKIVLGDLNARVGRNPNPGEPHVGKFSYHYRSNNNGERLVNFAAAHDLCISSTMSSRPRRERVTWVSADRVTLSQIDHILVQISFSSYISDVRSEWSACNDSDHLPVSAKFVTRYKPEEEEEGVEKPPKKLCAEALRAEKKQEEFVAAVEEQLKVSKINIQEAPVNSTWQILKNALSIAGEKVLGEAPKKKRKVWFNEECEEAREARDKSWRRHIRRPLCDLRYREYMDKKDKLDRLTKQAKKKHIESNVEALDAAHKVKDVRRFFAEVGWVKQGYSHRSGMVRCQEGGLATSPKKVGTILTEHFKNVLAGHEEAAERTQASAQVEQSGAGQGVGRGMGGGLGKATGTGGRRSLPP